MGSVRYTVEACGPLLPPAVTDTSRSHMLQTNQILVPNVVWCDGSEFPQNWSTSRWPYYNGVWYQQPVATASNFYNGYWLPSSNTAISYPSPQNYGTSGAVHSHTHYQHQPQLVPPMPPMVIASRYTLPLQAPPSSYWHPRNTSVARGAVYPGWGSRNTGYRNSAPLTPPSASVNLPYDCNNLINNSVVLDETIILDLDAVTENSNRLLSDEDMSYEELLFLQEQVGRIENGLSEKTISRHLKTRTHVSSANYINLEGIDQEHEICVICQVEYENNETIGTLQCGHDYHADCIKNWLLQSNVCPICRAKAFATDTES